MCGLGRVIHSDGRCKGKVNCSLSFALQNPQHSSQLVTVLPLLLLLLRMEIMLLLLLVLMISLLLLLLFRHLMLLKPKVMRIHVPSISTTISAILSPSIGHSSSAGDFQQRGQGAYTNNANYGHGEARDVGWGLAIDDNAEAD